MTAAPPIVLSNDLKSLLAYLNLAEADCCWLALSHVQGFTPLINQCHLNALIQKRFAGGTIVYGWLLWEDAAAETCEAMFHSVWRDDDGVMCDITPRVDGELKVLFVPDPNRQIIFFVGTAGPTLYSYDNVRVRDGKLPPHVAQVKFVVKAGLVASFEL